MTSEEKDDMEKKKRDQQRKKDAFLFVKRDNAEELRQLLDTLDAEGTAWRDWRDYASRSLLKCAKGMKTTNCVKLLEDREPANNKSTLPSSSSRMRQKSDVDVGAEEATPPEDVGPVMGPNASLRLASRISRPGTSRFDSNASQAAAAAAAGSTTRASTFDSMNALSLGQFSGTTPRVRPGSGGLEDNGNQDHASATAPEPRRSSENDAGGSGKPGGESNVDTVDADGVPAVHEHVYPELTEAELGDLQVKARRACCQDDVDALNVILHKVPIDTWSAWKNKNGDDLLTMAQQRDCSAVYGLLAKELDLVKEQARELSYLT
jgi:hypothetical protein